MTVFCSAACCNNWKKRNKISSRGPIQIAIHSQRSFTKLPLSTFSDRHTKRKGWLFIDGAIGGIRKQSIKVETYKSAKNYSTIVRGRNHMQISVCNSQLNEWLIRVRVRVLNYSLQLKTWECSLSFILLSNHEYKDILFRLREVSPLAPTGNSWI